MSDLYDSRSYDDAGEPLCTVAEPIAPAYKPFPTLPRVNIMPDMRTAAEILASECAEDLSQD